MRNQHSVEAQYHLPSFLAQLVPFFCELGPWLLLLSSLEKGKKLDYMVSHFGLLFWDRDTRAYEWKEMKIVLSH